VSRTPTASQDEIVDDDEGVMVTMTSSTTTTGRQVAHMACMAAVPLASLLAQAGDADCLLLCHKLVAAGVSRWQMTGGRNVRACKHYLAPLWEEQAKTGGGGSAGRHHLPVTAKHVWGRQAGEGGEGAGTSDGMI